MLEGERGEGGGRPDWIYNHGMKDFPARNCVVSRESEDHNTVSLTETFCILHSFVDLTSEIQSTYKNTALNTRHFMFYKHHILIITTL